MTPGALARLFGLYAAILLVACLSARSRASLHPPDAPLVVVSRWDGGKLVGRAVRPAEPPGAGGTTVEETATGVSPLSLSRVRFPLSLVPGRDGVQAELDGKRAFATVDDLLAAQAYDKASSFLDPSLAIGTQRAVVIHLLASQLGVPAREVETRATLQRVRFERRVVGPGGGVPAGARPRVTGATLDRATVLAAVRDAASFLARGVDGDGRYRYLVDATTDTTLGGYNWPRHGGTTFFLAQAAALLDDAEIRAACLRAAAHLRDVVLTDCGEHRCVSDGNDANVGSSALALLAFTEIARTGADTSYLRVIGQLSRFLRGQQRADGELMHVYDRAAKAPVDVQFLYFTGEASLALARAHRVTGDEADLRAASRALAHLSSHGWTFFGSRYYFTEEHWTCQAMADLWDRAPDEAALAFCLRWHEYQRALQHEGGDSPFDGDGSFGFGPLVTPRLTPAASRGEAAGAALAVLSAETARGSRFADPRTVALLDDELRRAIAFVVRGQLRPEDPTSLAPAHLLAHPVAVRGGVAGSLVDWQLRNDYAQHAGSMMTRWLALQPP